MCLQSGNKHGGKILEESKNLVEVQGSLIEWTKNIWKENLNVVIRKNQPKQTEPEVNLEENK